MKYSESNLENACLEWFGELGYQTIGGPDIDPQSEKPERKSFSEVVLVERLQSAIARINPKISAEAREEAFKKVVNVVFQNASLVSNNRSFHKFLRDGVDVETRRSDGTIAGDKVWLIDQNNFENNDWLVVNQFTVTENKDRRPDVVVFLNGLPVALFELKNMADETVGTKEAFNQIQTYKQDIPSIFVYNQLSIISDGTEAKVGSITSEYDRFMRWKTIDGENLAAETIPRIEVLIRGVFDKKRFLDLITNFIVFEDGGENISKKIAAYHQYHAVNKAVEKTLEASSEEGDRRIGVIWHTQGSGKSLTMVYFSGKIIDVLNNPTIVVITDRNDLDDQLFGTYSNCESLLRQKPEQAKNRSHLRDLLKVASGGVVFTTIQKFMPESVSSSALLSDRRNIVVIADEAHRSQYDFIDGFAKYMHDALPNASFIGFTGTPIERSDKNTRAVFGDYIDIYDIARAVEDGATVPIYYEARMAKIELLESEKPKLDEEFEEITENEEFETKEILKSKWARLEAMVGAKKRIENIAKDIVDHFENRLRGIEGKGMIVTMSRRIAVDLYNEIIKLRPAWHSDDDNKGFLKVVMTGSASDPIEYQKHVRSKQKRREIAKRFKNPEDEFKLAIVRDMWLTGFDVPCLHTMYLDKPMRGHGLMQAIARVNRRYGEAKLGGLIVDYLGLAGKLKEALQEYSETDRTETAIPQETAVEMMLEKYEIAKAILHGFNYKEYFGASAARQAQISVAAMDHILRQNEGKERFCKATTNLIQTFSLAVPHPKALEIRDDIDLFQHIKANLVKEFSLGGKEQAQDYDVAIGQIVSEAIASDEVINIFQAAGLSSPNISILSDEFLEEVKHLKYKGFAVDALEKLLRAEIKTFEKKNILKAKSFSDLLEETIARYHNNTIEAAQVISELVELAKKIKVDVSRGKDMGLSEDEIAFYDALANNESAVREMGDETLKKIAKELVDLLRQNVTIDWTLKESVQAKIRLAIKKLLNKYKYPPDQQKQATQTVLFQAENVCKDWTSEK